MRLRARGRHHRPPRHRLTLAAPLLGLALALVGCGGGYEIDVDELPTAQPASPVPISPSDMPTHPKDSNS